MKLTIYETVLCWSNDQLSLLHFFGLYQQTISPSRKECFWKLEISFLLYVIVVCVIQFLQSLWLWVCFLFFSFKMGRKASNADANSLQFCCWLTKSATGERLCIWICLSTSTCMRAIGRARASATRASSCSLLCTRQNPPQSSIGSESSSAVSRSDKDELCLLWRGSSLRGSKQMEQQQRGKNTHETKTPKTGKHKTVRCFIPQVRVVCPGWSLSCCPRHRCLCRCCCRWQNTPAGSPYSGAWKEKQDKTTNPLDCLQKNK